MQIEITGSAEERIRQLMAGGDYASAAEVVEALLAKEAGLAGPPPRSNGKGQSEKVRRQFTTYQELVQTIEPLQQSLPDDGLSGRDHDQILYRK